MTAGFGKRGIMIDAIDTCYSVVNFVFYSFLLECLLWLRAVLSPEAEVTVW